MRWNLDVVFISISFMAEDFEHSLMYLLAICTFLKIIPIHFPIGLFVLLVFNILSSMYIERYVVSGYQSFVR
jgi:hypothetical protein